MALKKTSKKGYEALIKVFERSNEIMRVSNVTAQAVRKWRSNNKIPHYRRPALIEAAKKRGWELSDEQLRGDL